MIYAGPLHLPLSFSAFQRACQVAPGSPGTGQVYQATAGPSLIPYSAASSETPPLVYQEAVRQGGNILLSYAAQLAYQIGGGGVANAATFLNALKAFKDYGSFTWSALAVAAYAALSFIPGLNGPSVGDKIRAALKEGGRRVELFYATFGHMCAMNNFANRFYLLGLNAAQAELNGGDQRGLEAMTGFAVLLGNLNDYINLCRSADTTPQTFSDKTREHALQLHDKELAFASDPRKAGWEVVEEMARIEQETLGFRDALGNMDANKTKLAWVIFHAAQAFGITPEIIKARTAAAKFLFYLSFGDNTEVFPNLRVGESTDEEGDELPDPWFYTVQGYKGLQDFRDDPSLSVAAQSAQQVAANPVTAGYVDSNWIGDLYKKFYPRPAQFGYEGGSATAYKPMDLDWIYHGKGRFRHNAGLF